MTGIRIKSIVLLAFITLTILYYFLRFQWEWDNYVVILQAGLLSFFAGIAVVRVMSKKSLVTEPAFFHIIVLYSILLLLPTFARGSFLGLSYGLKDFVLPALLLLGFSYFIPRNNPRVVFYYISFTGHILHFLPSGG